MGKAAKRERQRANREAKQEREAKDERRRRSIRFAIRAGIVLLIVIVAGVIFSSLGGSSDDTTTTSSADTTTATTAATDTTAPPATDAAGLEGQSPAYQAFRALPTACGGEQPEPPELTQYDTPVDQGIAADGRPMVTLRTSCGDIIIELDPTVAPESVNSFAFLAGEGFWDGTVSHRIVPGFVVQFGDPSASGTGGPGYNIVDEFPEAGFAYDRGVVAMAKTPAADSTGSQFFIGFADTGLNPEFNPIGRVVEGLDVLDLIEAVPVSGQSPLESVYLDEVVVEGL